MDLMEEKVNLAGVEMDLMCESKLSEGMLSQGVELPQVMGAEKKQSKIAVSMRSGDKPCGMVEHLVPDHRIKEILFSHDCDQRGGVGSSEQESRWIEFMQNVGQPIPGTNLL
jgi:hypothetical protein